MLLFSAPAGAVLPRAQFHASIRREEEAKAEETPAKSSSWDPIYAVPIGIAFAVPAINYEWYLVNEETQVCNTESQENITRHIFS